MQEDDHCESAQRAEIRDLFGVSSRVVFIKEIGGKFDCLHRGIIEVGWECSPSAYAQRPGLGDVAVVRVNIAGLAVNFVYLRPNYQSSLELLSTSIYSSSAITPNRMLAAALFLHNGSVNYFHLYNLSQIIPECVTRIVTYCKGNIRKGTKTFSVNTCKC